MAFSKTIDDLVNILLARVKGGSGSTDPLYSLALADLNMALQDLASAHHWSWLRKEVSMTVAANTRLLNSQANFPTDAIAFHALLSNFNNDRIPLKLISQDEFNDLHPDIAATGVPSHYIIGPLYQATATDAPVRAIELRPIASQSFVLYISYQDTFKNYTVAEKLEVPPLPPNYYGLIVEMASARFSTSLSRPKAQIDLHEMKALRLMEQLSRIDSDRNKVKSIRLPQDMIAYRANRYGLLGRRFQ